MNRIERYCDLNFAFLREHAGHIRPGHADVVVVAEEFAADGQVVRSWFLTLGERSDGTSLPATVPNHATVGTDIKPSEPTPAPVPGKQVKAVELAQLLRIRRERDEQLASRERHIIYSREWEQHLATISQQAGRIQQLESQLSEADARNSEASSRSANLANELQQVNSTLEALRRQRSWRQRANEWGQSARRRLWK